MGKVKVKSLVSRNILIDDENKRVKLTWDRKGATKSINLEDLEELVYDPGVEYMFKEGMLDIVDPKKEEIMVKLGLQEEGAAPSIIILSEGDMKKLMGEATSLVNFKKKISKLPKEQVNELIEYCVSNKIMNYEKTAILKEKTGKDIVSMIRLKEADKEASSKEE